MDSTQYLVQTEETILKVNKAESPIINWFLLCEYNKWANKIIGEQSKTKQFLYWFRIFGTFPLRPLSGIKKITNGLSENWCIKIGKEGRYWGLERRADKVSKGFEFEQDLIQVPKI